MAVYDLEEQEQLDELKSWWGAYGKFVLLAVVAAAVTASAVISWRSYQDRKAGEASVLYTQLQDAFTHGDSKRVQDIANTIGDQYPRAGYAVLAAFAAAKVAFDTNNTTEAKKYLQWVIDKARDDDARDTARLRLAAVLMDEKKYDDALKLIDAPHSDAWTVRYADLKGDLLVAQGKNDEARAAYQLALDKSGADSPYRTLIKIKLDALGAR